MSQELKPCPTPLLAGNWSREEWGAAHEAVFAQRMKYPPDSLSAIYRDIAINLQAQLATRSDAHLLRSHDATQAALKELEWIRDHVAQYGFNCNAPVVVSRASRALKSVDAALTEAAAQKENGNG